MRIELLRLAAEVGATENGELGSQLLDHQRGVDLGPEPGDVASQIVRQAAQIVGIAKRSGVDEDMTTPTTIAPPAQPQSLGVA